MNRLFVDPRGDDFLEALHEFEGVISEIILACKQNIQLLNVFPCPFLLAQKRTEKRRNRFELTRTVFTISR